MHRYRLYALSVIMVILLITGCKREEGTAKPISASYVKYQVVYLENMAGDIPTRLLPDKMDAYYSDKYIMTRIQGFFGQFSLVYVADLKRQNVISMLNFFGNKIYYTGKKGDIPVGIVSIPDPKVILTDDTCTYSGLLCRRAEIVTASDTYDIYFTKALDITSPNFTTPYRFIDDVLSDFRVQLSLLKMRLILDSYEEVMIDSSIFEIPEEYEEVSRDTMASIINSLFTKGS